MSTTKIVAEPGTQVIDVTREFAAPRDLVFRAYTEPELLTQWLGGTDLKMRIEEFEPRNGGCWRYIHTDQDDNEFAFRGVFHGDPTPDRFTQTFEFLGWEGKIALETMELTETDRKTTLRTHSVYQSVADRDGMIESGMEQGMNSGFDALDALLARL